MVYALVHLEAISWGGPMLAHPVRCPAMDEMALTAAAEAAPVPDDPDDGRARA